MPRPSKLRKPDAKDSASVAQGLFTSYSRVAAVVALGARVPLTPGSRPSALLLGASVEPVGSFAESPSGMTGKSPKLSPGIGWRAGISLTPSSRWNLLAGYSGGLRGASFSGAASSPLASPAGNAMTDAKLSEMVHSFSVLTTIRF